MQACDTHFHVFGPEERYPYSSDLRYTPPSAPLEDYLEHARELGIGRYVFVQPSAYGRDNRCMLDAMRAVGTQSCRGIVDIEEDTPGEELERLDAAGRARRAHQRESDQAARARIFDEHDEAHPHARRKLRPTRLDARLPHPGLAHPRADSRVPGPSVAVLDRAPRHVSGDGRPAAARVHGAREPRARLRALLGEAHRRVPHLARSRLRRYGAARARAHRRCARARDLGLRLPAPLVLGPGRLAAPLHAASRPGRRTSGPATASC